MIKNAKKKRIEVVVRLLSRRGQKDAQLLCVFSKVFVLLQRARSRRHLLPAKQSLVTRGPAFE